MAYLSELNAARHLASELNQRLAGRSAKPDLRSKVAAACAVAALQHHSAILILLANPRPLQATAIALIRVMTEATIRAAWLSYCATDAQVAKYIQPIRDNVPDFASLLIALDKVAKEQGSLKSAHASIYAAWPLLCGYSHTGPEVTLRLLTIPPGGDVYSDAEIVSALHMINGLAGFAFVTADGVFG
jgi:hypothetical protein